MPPTTAALIIQARQRLGHSQSSLGPVLGSSSRTSQRWERGQASPTPTQLHALARLVHDKSPDLAEQLAAEGHTTLADLGLGPPLVHASQVAHVVDSIVCAAAEAIDLSPRVVRGALAAAFTRARQVGLSLEVVEEALRPKDGGGKKKPTPGKKG